MKKSLLAVAAMGAFASAAQAQSSVTIYGILDAGYVGGNQRVQTTSVVGTNNNGFTIAGAKSTSRLGFKGVEDLGGGKSALFTVEATLAGDSTAVLGGIRQAFVGLKDNKLGAASVGLQNTIIHNAVGATDPGQQNNIAGNIIYAANSSQTNSSSTNPTFGQTDAYTIRTAQTLKYESPVFSGFKVNATYAWNNDNTTQTGAYNIAGGSSNGGTSNYNGWGLGADFTFQKFYATANYQALKSVQPYGSSTGANPYNPADAAWSTSTGGVNTQDNQAYIAATYDFGILKAYGQWINRKATAVQSSNYYLKRSAQQLGVRSYITPTVEAWASLGNGRWSSFGNAAPAANFTGYQVGSNYYLSKRTNLYAIFGSTQTSTTTAGAANQNNYAVGVRHTF
ncbi:porin [Polynucleobacter necessarius]|uniref:porin n=1 Tax=Polynucleobacter necessarius TaxID=576610 RepID=UPI000E08D67D|nr:porin [Polynucleobacter necessarius]HAT38861.1 porin [Polynucleobacter sp.]